MFFPFSLSFYGKGNVKDKEILNKGSKISFYTMGNHNLAKELMLHTTVVITN